ncbi:MAG: DUF4956 domain-containing protein, partial [Glutamicibacter sp.]
LRTVVVELDMVRDLTIVDVRFRTNIAGGKSTAKASASETFSGTYELANSQSAPAAQNGAKQETWS